MLVRVYEGSNNLLGNMDVEEGEYPIKFYSEPDHEFIIMLNEEGSEIKEPKLRIKKNDKYVIEMDDELVKKIKLYKDVDDAAISLFSNEELDSLKEGEISAVLF